MFHKTKIILNLESYSINWRLKYKWLNCAKILHVTLDLQFGVYSIWKLQCSYNKKYSENGNMVLFWMVKHCPGQLRIYSVILCCRIAPVDLSSTNVKMSQGCVCIDLRSLINMLSCWYEISIMIDTCPSIAFRSRVKWLKMGQYFSSQKSWLISYLHAPVHVIDQRVGVVVTKRFYAMIKQFICIYDAILIFRIFKIWFSQ